MNNFISVFWNRIFSNEKIDYAAIIKGKNSEIDKLNSQVSDYVAKNIILENKVYDYESILNNQNKESELEQFWNNKRPKVNLVYPARPYITNPIKQISVDPRMFFVNDDNIPCFVGNESNDIKAMKCLQAVIQMIKYVPDQTQYSSIEFWAFPFETLETKEGDCEDGAILIANMLLKSGIPYYQIRINAGDVRIDGELVGHAWCTYLRESDNVWIVLDWCFFPEEALWGMAWKDAEKYFDIWFSFNQRYIFQDDNLGR